MNRQPMQLLQAPAPDVGVTEIRVRVNGQLLPIPPETIIGSNCTLLIEVSVNPNVTVAPALKLTITVYRPNGSIALADIQSCSAVTPGASHIFTIPPFVADMAGVWAARIVINDANSPYTEYFNQSGFIVTVTSGQIDNGGMTEMITAIMPIFILMMLMMMMQGMSK